MACSCARRTAALEVDEEEVLLVVLVAVVDLSLELLAVLVAVVNEVAVVVVDDSVDTADAFKVPQSCSRVDWHSSCSSREVEA